MVNGIELLESRMQRKLPVRFGGGLLEKEPQGYLARSLPNIGEGLDRETLGELRALVEADPDVEHVQHLHTIYQGAHEVSLVIELRFCSTISALDIRRAVGRLKSKIQERDPEIRRVFFGAESITEDDFDEEHGHKHDARHDVEGDLSLPGR